MARFDVFANHEGSGYMLDVQADLLDHLNTRVVIPLLPRNQSPKAAQRLNPVFVIAGEEVVMMTQFIATVPCRILPIPIANLQGERDSIVNAIDFMLQGF
ncbi:CcdB family protein [Chrysiogenes arsenatis]|uniref:CcdB family protein n=1 Tax=Chrysiogenes arsenatis TaxID=309797 RepID=UPI00041C91A4|nr:CcdB family protein [Chrysiogenes arsenatis]